MSDETSALGTYTRLDEGGRSFSPLPAGRDESAPPGIDTTAAHPARIYDYYLGGKDNFAVDREAAEQVIKGFPSTRTTARENRAFMARAVRLAATAGVRQFLDVGTGIPTRPNTYEVARLVSPDSRVVHVDNDPLVLAHARAMMPERDRSTVYVQEDLREPERILEAAGELLDFGRPVALLLVAILHFFEDADEPRRLVETLTAALPPGSHLIASHMTDIGDPAGVGAAVRAYRERGMHMQPRDHDEFHALAFAGLDLVEPGIVGLSEWRPTEPNEPHASMAEVAGWGGVAVKSST